MLAPMRTDRAELLLASIKRYRENKSLPSRGKSSSCGKVQLRLKEMRLAAGLSITELSDKSGVARSYISELENNVYDNPSITVLLKLKAVLGCSLDDLVEIKL